MPCLVVYFYQYDLYIQSLQIKTKMIRYLNFIIHVVIINGTSFKLFFHLKTNLLTSSM